ncbi:MAG: hypothetical protein KatS3mg058_0605 [Roseiflexus sp.]|nr:MAG: hypothetical protein KatS3mg058_0605 [Roseiflexus sp.]
MEHPLQSQPFTPKTLESGGVSGAITIPSRRESSLAGVGKRFACSCEPSQVQRAPCNVARRSPLPSLASPQMRDTSRATPWSGLSHLSPLTSHLSPLTSRRSPLSTLASPQMRDTSRATLFPSPLPKCEIHLALRLGRDSRPSRRSPLPKCEIHLALRLGRDSRPSRRSPLPKCEIHLALRLGRDSLTSPLSPLAAHRSPLTDPLSRLSTNARYISRYALVGTLHKCEIHLALRLGRDSLASPLSPLAAHRSPLTDPLSRLSTNARYISRYALVGTLHKCEIHLALRLGRDSLASPLSPLASPQMRDKSRATPWSGLSRLLLLSTNAR